MQFQNYYLTGVPYHIVMLIHEMHPQLKKKIRAELEIIRDKPHSGKALRADLESLMTFRLLRLRIIYKIISEDLIELVAVGPRETIYEETYRLINKE